MTRVTRDAPHFIRVGPAPALVRGPNVGQPVPVTAVDPKKVGGVEGVDKGRIQNEFRLQIVEQVVFGDVLFGAAGPGLEVSEAASTCNLQTVTRFVQFANCYKFHCANQLVAHTRVLGFGCRRI